MTHSQPAPTHPEIDELNRQAHDMRHEDTRQALQLSRRAIELSKAIEYSRGLANALYTTGVCTFILAEMGDMLDSILQAQSLFESLNDQEGIGRCLNLLANVYERQSDYTLALEYNFQSLEVRRSSGDKIGEAGSLNNIGLVYFSMLDYAHSLDYLNQSLQIARLAGDIEAEAYARGNLARLYLELNDPDKALANYNKVLIMVRETNDRALESSTLADLALFYINQAKPEVAIEFLERALELTDQTGNVGDRTNVLIDLGRVYQTCEMYAKAESMLLDALDLTRKSQDRQQQAEVHSVLGDGYLQQEDIAQAIVYLHKAVALAAEIQSDQIRSDASLMLSQAYRVRGDWKNAYDSFQVHHLAWQKTFITKNEHHIQALLAQKEVKQAQEEAEQHRMESIKLSEALDALRLADEQKARLLHRLEMQAKVLVQLSREDGLTGLANRRWLDVRLLEEFERAARFEHDLTVAMVDLDDFKAINDTFSHQVGDVVLQRVASLLREGCRTVDIAGRYGGEEFMLIMVEASLDDALHICERINASIRQTAWRQIHKGIEKLTVSIGLGHISQASSPEELLARADKNLYRAKHEGKDQVIWRSSA